jgi:hypothetical protein
MRKADQGIEITCCECNKVTKLKTWTKENQTKKEENSYICKSCRQSGDRARGFAKLVQQADYWTPERRQKQSKMNSGKNNAMFGVSWKEFADSETILRHSQKSGRPGQLNGMFGVSWKEFADSETILRHSTKIKEWANSPEGKEVCRRGGLNSSSRPIRMTNPERKVREWLNENNIEHTYGARVENRSFDFRVGNTLIEVHGDYWHANPLYYGEGKRQLTERQLFKVDVDKLKQNIALRHQLQLVVIWETEINNGDFSKLEVLKGM